MASSAISNSLALARCKRRRVDFFLRQPVDRPEAKARRLRAEDPACGQKRRRLHVGRDQSEALDLVAHRVDGLLLTGR